MTKFWEDHPDGKKELLRLLSRDGTWLRWESEDEDPGNPDRRPKSGCKEQVEEMLSSALHSTNVVVLLGSGASFSARNEGGPHAPSMRTLWETVKNIYGSDDFDELVKSVMGHTPNEGEGNIEALLSLCKMTAELLEVRTSHDATSQDRSKLEEIRRFIGSAENTILDQVGFVDSDTTLVAHAGFLRKFARRSPAKPRVKIFTTNYDLCIETAAMRSGVALIDGFSRSAEQRFNRDHFQHDIVRRVSGSTKADFLDGVFHLYKLHGSVDWRRREDETVIRSIDGPNDKLKPVLIYPRSSKYQEAFESPYLDMFAALQAALREPDTTLIISGYGFADDHVSAPIWAALETNLSLRLILCDVAFVTNDNLLDLAAQEVDSDLRGLRPYQMKVIRLVQQGDTRLSVLNGRFEDFADALPSISGKTDWQLLQSRLDAIREM